MKTAPPRVATRDSRRVAPAGGSSRQDKRRAPIYATPEYLAWRAEIMRRSGGQCQDPGHDPATPRAGIRLFADHVVELRDGGAPFDPANGLVRCGACHTSKTIAERVHRLKG